MRTITFRQKLANRIAGEPKFHICLPYDQLRYWAETIEPNMTLKRALGIMNRVSDLEDRHVPYHFVGTQIYVDGEPYDAPPKEAN